MTIWPRRRWGTTRSHSSSRCCRQMRSSIGRSLHSLSGSSRRLILLCFCRQQAQAPDSTPLPVDYVDGGLSFSGKVQLFSNMFPVVVLRRALETQWGFTAVITAVSIYAHVLLHWLMGCLDSTAPRTARACKVRSPSRRYEWHMTSRS